MSKGVVYQADDLVLSTLTLVKPSKDAKCGVTLQSTTGQPTYVIGVKGICEAAGLRVKDQLVSVNGVAVTGADQGSNLIKAAEGDVKIEYGRAVATPRGFAGLDTVSAAAS